MRIQMISGNKTVETLAKIYRHKAIYLVIGFLPIIGAAQELAKNTVEMKDKYYFSPRISVKQEFTNNAKLNDSNISGSLTQVSPGLQWISNAARVKGFVDYSLDATADSDGIRRHYIRNRLNANAAVELVEQFAFVDVSGSISTQPISAFGQAVDDSRVTPNSTEVKNFQISPYVLGSFGNNFDYEARYSIQNVRSGAGNIGDSTVQKIKMNLESPASGKSLSWSALASYESSDFEMRRNISTGTIRGALNYGVTPQIAFSLIAGAESTDQISPKRESHSILGFGAQWRPSERTKLGAFVERRYFGNAHNIAFEHRTEKTIWRYTDVKGISNGFDNSSAIAGSIFDLLNGFYTQIEADPVRRTQLVLAEIERLGLTSDTQVFKDFLRSTSTLQRAQNLSLILLGQRSTVTLSAFRLSNQRLAGEINLEDDFEKNERIRQNGWSLLVAHRLSPGASVFANLSAQRSIGTVPGLKNQLRSFKLGLNQTLSRRTSASIQLNRSLSEQGIGGYSESSLMGIMTHRF